MGTKTTSVVSTASPGLTPQCGDGEAECAEGAGSAAVAALAWNGCSYDRRAACAAGRAGSTAPLLPGAGAFCCPPCPPSPPVPRQNSSGGAGVPREVNLSCIRKDAGSPL